jgi:hypothetical protein
MPMPRPLRWVLGLGLAGLLIVGGLLLLPFSDWLPGGTVAQIPNQEVVNGTAFNRLFPSPGTGEEVVFTQEKRGFSEAKLKRGGELLALLAISDTTTAPEAKTKFQATSQQINGWPLVEQGPQVSALLVADRFQVKVIGQGSGLDPDRRHALLGAFDLSRLAALEPSSGGIGKLLPPASGKPLEQLAPNAASQPALEPAA